MRTMEQQMKECPICESPLTMVGDDTARTCAVCGWWDVAEWAKKTLGCDDVTECPGCSMCSD